MVITYDEKTIFKKILISEKELNDINFERLKIALMYIKSNTIDPDDNMYLNVDSLIDINVIITGLNHITLRKVNLKLCGYNEMYMDKDLIEDKLYQSDQNKLDQFNEGKINHIIFVENCLIIYNI